MTEPAALPPYVQIEPVGQCNLRCTMCPIQYRGDGPPGPSAFMAFERFRALLDQFPQATELHLQGMGEPFLHPRLFDMARLAAERGLQVSTNTNMTIMTEAMAAECVRCGLRTIHVSLDAAEAPAYEAICRRARFAKVLRNLRRLMRAKTAAASALHVRLVAVVMRQNLDQLSGLVRLAAREGIAQLSVQHLCHDFGEPTLPARHRAMREFIDAQSLLGADPAAIAVHFDAARAEAATLGIDLRLPRLTVRQHAPGTPGRERCAWPWRGAYISYDGKAMPCCMIGTPDRLTLGDVARESVSAVWNNDAYQHFRQQLSSDAPPDVCRSCAIYNGTF